VNGVGSAFMTQLESSNPPRRKKLGFSLNSSPKATEGRTLESSLTNSSSSYRLPYPQLYNYPKQDLKEILNDKSFIEYEL
jgi:hypothetical protein